jgi:hypothetical protein
MGEEFGESCLGDRADRRLLESLGNAGSLT